MKKLFDRRLTFPGVLQIFDCDELEVVCHCFLDYSELLGPEQFTNGISGESADLYSFTMVRKH